MADIEQHAEAIAGTFLALCAAAIWLPSHVRRWWVNANARVDGLIDAALEPTDEWSELTAVVDEARDDVEQHARERQASLNAHPSAGRIYDQIAANQAEDIDTEWLQVAKEWTA